MKFTDAELIEAWRKRSATGSEPRAKRAQTTSASAPPKAPTRVTPTPSERPSSDALRVGTQPNLKLETVSPIRSSLDIPFSPQPSSVARVSQPSSSAPVSPALESDIYIPKWSVKASDSGINNAQVAEELARAILLPEDKKAFRRWQANELVEEAYKSVIRADIICLMQDEMMALEHLVTKTEEKLKVVEHKSAEVEGKLKADLQEADEKLKAAIEKLEGMEVRAAVAKSVAEIAELRLIEAKKRIQAAEQQAAVAEEKAARAEEKAARAGEIYLASEEFTKGAVDAALPGLPSSSRKTSPGS